MPRRTGLSLNEGMPLRALAQRFAYLALIGAAVALMLLGKLETVLIEEARMRATDAVAPILDLLSRPLTGVAGIAQGARELAAIQEENRRLREENARLMHWQLIARRLEGENESLRRLLNLEPPAPVTFISARAIADTGGAFARTILVNVGARDGVAKRQPVISGEGLVGRVAQVGHRSARVLLITDLNSQIPVVVGDRRRRAILVGDNGERPLLEHVDGETEFHAGDYVMTSGHGGVFPPGLPVGVVAGESARGIEVQPFVDWHRLDLVRVLDYGGQVALGADLPN